MGKATATVVTVAAVTLLSSGVWWWYCVKEWGAWHEFATRFVQSDGRVIDYAAADRSTSEGQAYALFFALVAGDRQRFDKLLRWTEDNLAQGDLQANLPAWLWGQREDNSWGVIDENPASDSDLWLAYTLLQAGRLWEQPGYTRMANGLLEQISAREVVTLPHAGKMLLPAPRGFHGEDGSWRLNPSYVPPFLFAGLAQHNPAGPWSAINQTANFLLEQAAPKGLAPDWYLVTADGRVRADTETAGRGSYDAIRVYLWAGLSRHITGRGLSPVGAMADLIQRHGTIPERVDTQTGSATGTAPVGFAGALLPYVTAIEDDGMRAELSDHLVDLLEQAAELDDYYDSVLVLFGSGWHQGRYRITDQGRINTRWSRNCCEILH